MFPRADSGELLLVWEKPWSCPGLEASLGVPLNSSMTHTATSEFENRTGGVTEPEDRGSVVCEINRDELRKEMEDFHIVIVEVTVAALCPDLLTRAAGKVEAVREREQERSGDELADYTLRV